MRIQFLNGENAGTWRDIESDGVGIGRETDNGIQLLGGRVSRYHARLERRGDDGWFILDLGSTNGTRLNGKDVTGAVKIQDGDVVAVGDITFRIEETGEAAQQKKETTEPAFVFRPPENHVNAAPPPSSPPGVQQKTEAVMRTEPDKENLSRTIPDLDNLFKRDPVNHTTSVTNDKTPPSPNKKRIVNLLFLLLVVSVAAISLFIFVQLQKQENQGASREDRSGVSAIPNPFFVFYEKRDVKDNSMFCFRILLEDGHLTFLLYDFKSGRDYSPIITDPVRPEAIEKLKKAILDTGFMSTEQQEALSDTSEGSKKYSRLVIGFDDKFNDVTVQEIVLTSFTRVEEAILDFLQEEYGLDASMAKSRDELIQEARSSFDLAEKQFASYTTQPENLWKSIENYKIALHRYEVFADKPPEWAVARAHLAEAEEALREVLETGHKRVNQLCHQREYRKAIDECARLMEFFPPEDEHYQKIRATKIELEKLTSKDK